MTSPPVRASAFPRSARAIQTDSLAPGLAILIVLVLVLLAWVLWLVFFKVPFTQTSQSAQITPDALVVADFPPAVAAQIRTGQDAVFIPATDLERLSGRSTPLSATVVEVDTTGQAWLLLTASEELQSQLYPGLTGQVQVVVQERSPLSLILDSVRLNASSS